MWAQPWHTGFAAPWHVESSRTRVWTCVFCISRQLLNHWTTREDPVSTFLAVVNSASVDIQVFKYLSTCFQCLGIYVSTHCTHLGELLGHLVILFNLWGTAELCSRVGSVSYISICNRWGGWLQFLHIFVNTLIVILVGVKWNLIMVSICISLSTNDIEDVFICL